jgi:hypothetical protein
MLFWSQLMNKPLFCGLVASTFLLLASGGKMTQVGQTQRFPQFENEEVKVWKSIVLPNEPLAMHRHDHPRIIIALVGGTMNIVEQSGNSETHDWQSGKAYWLPANAPGRLH